MPPKKKNYFDNNAVEKALLQFQKTMDENSRGDTTLLEPFTEQIQTLVKIVINVHKIYRFHNDLDELVQEGLVAVYSSFGRFDPSKGTAFNYLSITVKNHLKNWTQSKNKKAWVTVEFNDTIYDAGEDSITDGFYIHEALSQVSLEPKYDPIMDDIINLISNDKIYNKRDIIKQLIRNGWDRSEIEVVYNAMEEHFGTEESE
jgi:hypothetical protein